MGLMGRVEEEPDSSRRTGYSRSFWSGGMMGSTEAHLRAVGRMLIFQRIVPDPCRFLELYNAHVYPWIRIKMRFLIRRGGRPFRLGARATRVVGSAHRFRGGAGHIVRAEKPLGDGPGRSGESRAVGSHPVG
jgi:hypothetical protein